MTEMFPDEVLPHTEFIRFAGRITCSALPIVRYTTEERLNEIIALHEKNGVFIANPHVYTLEDGTRHKSTGADRARHEGGGRSVRAAQSGQDADVQGGEEVMRVRHPRS